MSFSVSQLSFGQLEILRLISDPTGNPPWYAKGVMHVSQLWPIPPAFSISDCINAIVRMVEYHDTLRTQFSTNGTPLQITYDRAETQVNVSKIDGVTSATEEDALAQRLGSATFDLDAGALWRSAVYYNSAGKIHVGLAIHHLLVDYVGAGILRKHFYESLATRPGASASTRRSSQEIARVQRSEEWSSKRKAAIAHWKDTLGDDADDLKKSRLYTPHSRAARYEISTPLGHTRQDVIDTARKLHLPASSVIVAAAALAIMKHAGREHVVVNLASSNRFLLDWRNTAGTFVQFVPVRLRISRSSETLADFCRSCFRSVISSIQHGFCDIDEVCRELAVSDVGAAPTLGYRINISPSFLDTVDLTNSREAGRDGMRQAVIDPGPPFTLLMDSTEAILRADTSVFSDTGCRNILRDFLTSLQSMSNLGYPAARVLRPGSS
jgi:hypothetical protein